MVGETDIKDKNEARKIVILLISLVAVLLIGGALLFPALMEIATVHMLPGLGFKDAAVISFFVTIVLMIVLTITAGEGLLGELQFVLGGFFLFFLIIWMFIAWIF